MVLQHLQHELDVFLFPERLDIHEAHVAAALERAVDVHDVRDAAAHARSEVAARAPEDEHATGRHVLAAVIAHALDDSPDAAVADGKALARDSRGYTPRRSSRRRARRCRR